MGDEVRHAQYTAFSTRSPSTPQLVWSPSSNGYGSVGRIEKPSAAESFDPEERVAPVPKWLSVWRFWIRQGECPHHPSQSLEELVAVRGVACSPFSRNVQPPTLQTPDPRNRYHR